jgi:hypothetical protein
MASIIYGLWLMYAAVAVGDHVLTASETPAVLPWRAGFGYKHGVTRRYSRQSAEGRLSHGGNESASQFPTTANG